jgi:hypothetical protein
MRNVFFNIEGFDVYEEFSVLSYTNQNVRFDLEFQRFGWSEAEVVKIRFPLSRGALFPRCACVSFFCSSRSRCCTCFHHRSAIKEA